MKPKSITHCILKTLMPMKLKVLQSPGDVQ